ncbi:MAG: hypothetical protein U0903_01070 [Planctomycetales bacterium]
MTLRKDIRRALWLIFGSLLSIPLMFFAVKFFLDNFVEHVPPNQGAMVLGFLVFATWTLFAIFVVIVSHHRPAHCGLSS